MSLLPGRHPLSGANDRSGVDIGPPPGHDVGVFDQDIDLTEYRKNPCGMLPAPLWKFWSEPAMWQMEATHITDPTACSDGEVRFRIKHPLTGVEDPIAAELAPGFHLASGSRRSPDELSALINQCREQQVTPDDVASFKRRAQFRPSLWVLALDARDRPAGFGLAECDQKSGEGSLEWIQVVQEYQSMGVGRLLVSALLSRLQDLAAFATASGRVGNPHNPEGLYRACGFVGKDLWCIRH